MQSPMPECDTSGWVILMHRAWIFYASEMALVSHSRGLSRTATFAPEGKLNRLLILRQLTTRSAGALYASGQRRLQVRQQDNRRVHQVVHRLLVDQQEPSSSVVSTVRRLDAHSLRRPHRSLARRQERRVHREEFRQYCLETGIIQEFAATNLQQTDVSERVERTPCAMVWCMLAESGFPSMWGKLFMVAAYLKNMTSHEALKTETLFNVLHDKEVDLSYLCVIGARTFVHIKDSRKLDAAA